MTHDKALDDVLLRINDMRGFFKFGDEVIPFLGDLFTFLKDIMPLMNEMNHSLQETSEKLPTASDRINDATQVTEYATHEILDGLDRISATLNKVVDLEKEERVTSLSDVHTEIDNIVNALQFQDITAQKLEHANRILGAIHGKFTLLFDSLNKAKISTAIGGKVMEAFHDELELSRQLEERENFEKTTEDKMHHESISQSDIDSLFD